MNVIVGPWLHTLFLEKGVDAGRVTKKEATPRPTVVSLSDTHSSHLLKSICAKIQVEDVTSATEPILLGGENPTSEEILVLALHIQRKHRVYHVLQLVASSHLAGLVDLTDNDRVDHVSLAIVRNELKASLSRRGRDSTGVELAIVHALEGIHDQDEVLSGVRSANSVAVLEEGGNVILLPCDETAPKIETLSGHAHLIEAFLCGVEQGDATLPGDVVRQAEHHCGLARPRGASEKVYG